MIANLEKEMEAEEYLEKYPKTTPRELAKKFEISHTTAYKLDRKVNPKTIALKGKPWDYIEDEIKGLDWQYNPEKEIRNLQIPKY